MSNSVWGLLLANYSDFKEVNTSSTATWLWGGTTNNIRFYVNAYGMPTTIHTKSTILAASFVEVIEHSFESLIYTTETFPRCYGDPEALEILGKAIGKWHVSKCNALATPAFQINKLKEQLEAKDREIHDLKCELERVRMINDGLFKKLGV